MKRALYLLKFGPFIEPVSGNQASAFGKALSEGGFLHGCFAAGVYHLGADGNVLCPKRHESPPHQSYAPSAIVLTNNRDGLRGRKNSSSCSASNCPSIRSTADSLYRPHMAFILREAKPDAKRSCSNRRHHALHRCQLRIQAKSQNKCYTDPLLRTIAKPQKARSLSEVCPTHHEEKSMRRLTPPRQARTRRFLPRGAPPRQRWPTHVPGGAPRLAKPDCPLPPNRARDHPAGCRVYR